MFFVSLNAFKIKSLFSISMLGITSNFFYDVAERGQMLFQDPATGIMEALVDFHHDLMFFLIIIVTLIFWLLFRLYAIFNVHIDATDLERKKELYKLSRRVIHYRDQYQYFLPLTFSKNVHAEIIWTIVPFCILLSIMPASFSLLYAMDDMMIPSITMKCHGHQWFWNYNMADTVTVVAEKSLLSSVDLALNDINLFANYTLIQLEQFLFANNLLFNEHLNFLLFDTNFYMFSLNELLEESFFGNGIFTQVSTMIQKLFFDSYMVAESDLEVGQFRLLEVDKHIYLPLQIFVRLLVSAEDVLHSFAVPALGIKMDACPGRSNQIGLLIKRFGRFYGQCSEICGTNHAFMPIVIECVSQSDFMVWYAKNSNYLPL